MRNWLAKIQPTPWLFKKLVILGMLVAVGMSAFYLGRSQKLQATPPGRMPHELSVTAAANPTEQGRRIVAYLYGQPVSREELGEYLIARFGVERLVFMLNRKIVETEAARLNIYVTDAEVNIRFERDLKAIGPQMTEKDFVNGILHRFNKTLFEWKEDVIRPKLMMEKIVRPHVQAMLTDKDLREGFEAKYGPKVQCRMIVFAKADRTIEKIVADARQSKEAFLAAAKVQAFPNLAQTEGKVPPIHKYFGDNALEEAAFRLKEGEISGLIQMNDRTYVLLMCEKLIPPDASKRFENERASLSLEMEELRLLQRIPIEFEEMKKRANPNPVLVAGQQQTAMLQMPASSSLAQESGSGVVQASSNVVVPPAPLPGEVKPMVAPAAPPQHVGPVVIPELPDPPPMPKSLTDKAPTSSTTPSNHSPLAVSPPSLTVPANPTPTPAPIELVPKSNK